MENREWVCIDGHWMERQIEESKKAVRKATSKQLAEVKMKIFEKFIKQL